MKVSVLACACALAMTCSVSAETLLFDFGNVNQLSPEAPNTPAWNNILRPADGGVPPVIVDSQGNNTTVGLVFTEDFFINGPPSQLGSEAPAGDAAAYPVSATDDYLFGHTGPFAGEADNSTSSFTLFGLDPNLVYDFTFFSARNGVNDNRDTAYALTGLNSGSGVATTANNDTEVLVISGISPTLGGSIDIDVSAAATNTNGLQFYYLNVMQIDVQEIPEPSSTLMALLGMASIGLSARLRG